MKIEDISPLRASEASDAELRDLLNRTGQLLGKHGVERDHSTLPEK